MWLCHWRGRREPHWRQQDLFSSEHSSREGEAPCGFATGGGGDVSPIGDSRISSLASTARERGRLHVALPLVEGAT